MEEINIAKYEIRTEIETNTIFLKITLKDGKWYEMKLSLTDMVNLRRDLNKAVDRVLQNAA